MVQISNNRLDIREYSAISYEKRIDIKYHKCYCITSKKCNLVIRVAFLFNRLRGEIHHDGFA